MAEPVKLSIPDDHYKWLEEVRKKRGWDSIQEAIRSILEDIYRMEQRGQEHIPCLMPVKDSGNETSA